VIVLEELPDHLTCIQVGLRLGRLYGFSTTGPGMNSALDSVKNDIGILFA
jgi:hypothetical protein